MAAPYYPGITVTPNLGLSLIGMDEVVAEDFILIDAFAGGVSGSIQVNGVVVENPNFVNSASVTFAVLGSNISLTASGSGGGGTVTSFSAGALSPLFTTSVATPTSTPALSFSLSNAAQNTVFAGPAVGGAGAPSYRALVPSDIPALASSLNIPIAGSTNIPSPLFSPSEAPSGVNTAMFVQDANGSWHQMAGMDTSTVMSSNRGVDGLPTVPAGILTWDRMMYFRDTENSVQSGKNAYLSINHLAAVGTSYNNQDRAIWVTMGNIKASIFQFSIDSSNNVTFNINSIVTGFAASGAIGFRVNQRIVATGLSVGTYLNSVQLSITSATAISGGQQTIVCSDSGFTHAAVTLTSDTGSLNQAMYAMENVQMEQDVVGSPLFVSAVDGEASTLSVQMSDQHIGDISAPNYGCNAIRVQYYREAGTGSWGSVHPACIRSILTDNNDGTNTLDTVTNIFVQGTAAIGNNDLYYSIHILAPTTRFGGGTNGLVIDDFGSNASDFALKVVGGQTSILGTLFLGTLSSVTAWPSVSAKQVLIGPVSGAAAAATFRVLANTDIPAFTGDSGSGGTLGGVPAPGAGDAAAGKFLAAGGVWSVPSGGGGGSVAWSSITSAVAGLTLSNGSNATEFDQTSAVTWAWKNTTAATGTTNQSSPIFKLAGRYFSGSDAEDNWTIQDVVANGTNKLSQLVLAHSGTSGPAQVQVPANAGTANTPALVFGSVLNTGGTYGPGIMNTNGGAGTLGLSPGDGSGNVAVDLRFYRLSSGSPTNSYSITNTSNSAGGIQLSVQEGGNALQQVNIFSAQGTSSGVGIQLGGNGGNNGRDFSATSGVSVATSIGAASGAGRVLWNPSSGSGTFVGLQVIPTVNQTSTASGSYTAFKIAVTETALLGSSNKLIDCFAGAAGTTEVFAVDNTGKLTEYAGSALVSQGIPSEIVTVDLTAQSAAIGATNITASAPATGMYRISWSAAITTAGTASVLGGTNGFQIGYTSPTDSVAKLTVSGNSTTSSANTTGTAVGGSIVIYAKTGTAITYQIDYTSSGTTMVYELHIKLERL